MKNLDWNKSLQPGQRHITYPECRGIPHALFVCSTCNDLGRIIYNVNLIAEDLLLKALDKQVEEARLPKKRPLKKGVPHFRIIFVRTRFKGGICLLPLNHRARQVKVGHRESKTEPYWVDMFLLNYPGTYRRAIRIPEGSDV